MLLYVREPIVHSALKKPWTIWLSDLNRAQGCFLSGGARFTGHPDASLETAVETRGSVPYDSGQVNLVFGWVRSMREEGVSHGTAGTRKTLGTRLANTKKCNEKKKKKKTCWSHVLRVSSPPSEGQLYKNCSFESRKNKNACLKFNHRVSWQIGWEKKLTTNVVFQHLRNYYVPLFW